LADPGDLFQTGDVLVATGTSIQWRKPDWTLKSTLSVGGTVGDMAFDRFGNLYATDVSTDEYGSSTPRVPRSERSRLE
jgi:hypothetical protein